MTPACPGPAGCPLARGLAVASAAWGSARVLGAALSVCSPSRVPGARVKRCHLAGSHRGEREDWLRNRAGGWLGAPTARGLVRGCGVERRLAVSGRNCTPLRFPRRSALRLLLLVCSYSFAPNCGRHFRGLRAAPAAPAVKLTLGGLSALVLSVQKQLKGDHLSPDKTRQRLIFCCHLSCCCQSYGICRNACPGPVFSGSRRLWEAARRCVSLGKVGRSEWPACTRPRYRQVLFCFLVTHFDPLTPCPYLLFCLSPRFTLVSSPLPQPVPVTS